MFNTVFPTRSSHFKARTFFFNVQRNIVALQVEKRCCTYYHPPQTLSRNKLLLLQVENICWKKSVGKSTRQFNFASTCCFNLQQQHFVAWQCLRWVVIRTTTLFNLQRNNVVLQVAAICCLYYFTFSWLNQRKCFCQLCRKIVYTIYFTNHYFV